MSNGLLSMLEASCDDVGQLRDEVDRLNARLRSADGLAAAVDALVEHGWKGEDRLSVRTILADARFQYGRPISEEAVLAVLQEWQARRTAEPEEPYELQTLAPWLSPPAALRDWVQGLWEHGMTGDDIRDRVGALVDGMVDSATAADREKWLRERIDETREGKPLIHADER